MMSNTYTNLSSTTAAVTNRFVTSVVMKVGAYTLANTTAAHGAGFLVTIGHTTNGGADTLGTIVIVGKTLAGSTVTETLTPSAGSTVTGTTIFQSLTSVTGAGWVTDGTDDNIIVGQASGAYVMGTGGHLGALIINTTSASTITLNDARGTIGVIPASVAAGTEFEYDLVVSGYLRVVHTSTSNYTLVHAGTVPVYATA